MSRLRDIVGQSALLAAALLVHVAHTLLGLPVEGIEQALLQAAQTHLGGGSR
jgi:hypothetical protein